MELTIVLLIIMVMLLGGTLIYSRKQTTKLEAMLVRAQHAIREAAKPNNRPVVVNDDYPTFLLYKSLVPQLQTEGQSTFIVGLPSFEIKIHIPVHDGHMIIENTIIENTESNYGVVVKGGEQPPK